MLSFIHRLVRLFWRPETGTSSAERIVMLPAAEPVMPAVVSTSSVEIRPVLARDHHPVPAAPMQPARLMAARLQAVERLNPPKSRAAKKAGSAQPGKPKPKSEKVALKHRPASKSGVVTARLKSGSTRQSAEIIDLTEARNARRQANHFAA